MIEGVIMDRKYDAHPNCLVFFALILFCIFFACLMMVITGTATLSISGFAVDSSDRLYVGMQKEICVYENGTIIDRLSPHTSRTYIFTITEDDTILLSTSTTIYVMDLKGNILERREDKGADLYNQLSYRRKQFVSHNGDIYKHRGIFGITQIVKNGTDIVYKTTPLSFAVKACLLFSVVGLVMLLLYGLSTQHIKKIELE